MNEKTMATQKIRDNCLANAEGLLSAAERELDKGVDNVCFHLALLALEEIGKAIMVSMSLVVSMGDKELGNFGEAFGDHEKKLFWALWAASTKGSGMTKEEIEKARDMSKTLHERRLIYLYTDPSGVVDGRAEIREGEAKNLVELTRARLEMEKLKTVVDDFNEEDTKILTWFYDAIKDEEKAKSIFTTVSMKKFQELGNGKEWMKWLKEAFDKNDEQMRELTQKELTRQRPKGDEAWIPKYKMTVRIQTQSHSIRNNAFTKWNAGIKDIKLRKSDRKEAKRYAKDEMILELTIPKAIQVSQLWDHGFFMAKTFINALNIGTHGLFWWYVPKDIEKFYEEITDLDVDKAGNVKLHMTMGKKLALAWDGQNMVLDEAEVQRVMVVYPFLMRESKTLEEFMKTYAFALTIFAKIDIHFRVEPNAFNEFFKAFKAALIALGDWDGKSDLKQAILTQFKGVSEAGAKELEAMIQTATDFDPALGNPPNITLTEIAAMKLYCDVYIQLKANQSMEKFVAENKT
ncbi:MAG: AbiV family abortive infection protein [Minisyncoccia bacterium]